jgi:hypothetical protein
MSSRLVQYLQVRIEAYRYLQITDKKRSSLFSDKEKSFITLTPGVNIIKLSFFASDSGPK